MTKVVVVLVQVTQDILQSTRYVPLRDIDIGASFECCHNTSSRAQGHRVLTLTCNLKGGDWPRHSVGEMVTISPSGVACCVAIFSKAASTWAHRVDVRTRQMK